MAIETPEPQVTGATYLPLVQQLESSADDARSPKGAVGRFQIMPGTARQYGFDPAQLSDPKTNEAAATAILSDLHQRFSGNAQDILVAYNAGPGTARRWIAGGRNPSDLPGETQAYLSHASQIMSGGGLPTEPHVITATNATPSMPPKAPALAPGERDIFDLRSSGKFTDQQISQYFADTTTKLMNAGFKPDAISDYWGERAPKQAIIDAYVDRNIRAAVAGKNAPEIANSPIEAFKAGWDNSATALTGATQLPNTVLPEHAPLLNTVMAGTGRMVGDLPFMIEGAVLGGAAGLPTGPGALITAGMGAMGVPAAVREIYLDRLRAKEIHDPMQFTAMIGRSLMDTASQTAIGGLSAGAGGAVEAGVSEITGAIAGPGIGKFAGGVANTTTNAATFTALSAAAAGKMPSADDAITTAILALGMHGAMEVGGKLVPTQGAHDLAANMEKIWAATGLTPKEQFDLGRTDRVLGQETMAQDPSGEPVIPNLQQHAPPEPEPYNALTPLAGKPPIEESNTFNGSIQVLHGSGQKGLQAFRNPAKVDPGLRYDGGGPGSAAFGPYTYFDEKGNWNDNSMARGINKSGGVYSARVDFKNAFVLTPDTIGAARKAADIPENAPPVGGEELADKLHAKGYDGIIVRGFTAFDEQLHSGVGDEFTADAFRREHPDDPATPAYPRGTFPAAEALHDAEYQKLVDEGLSHNAEEIGKPLTPFHVFENEIAARGLKVDAAQDQVVSLEPHKNATLQGKLKPEEIARFRAKAAELAAANSGGGDSGPPKPPPPEPEVIPPEPGDKKIETDRAPATEAELNERASEFIGAAKPDPWWKRLLPDFAKFYNQWVSELGDARQVDRELANQGKYDPKTQLGLEDMLRQTFASDSRASLMVTHGGIDAISLARRPEVPSLMDAIRAVKEDSKGHNDETSVVDAWVNYMVAQRANALEDRGLVTGHPLSHAERDELIAFGDKKFARGTEMWNRAMDGALDYGRDSGVFSQIQVDAMRRDNPMYISFRRLAGDPSLPKSKGRTFKTFEPVKTYEGSDGQIVNPLLASLENMYAIVRAADRNRAVGAFVNLEQTRGVAPADLGLQKLAYQPNATIAEPGIRAGAESNKGNAGDTFHASAEDQAGLFKPYAVNDQTAYEPWLAVRQARRSADPNTFMYLRDGKPEWWRAEDEDFARLIRGSDSPGQADIFTTAAQKIAALSRAGIVGAIDFPLRILGVRHPLGAYIFDPAHPNPILSFIKGVVPTLTKNGLWEDWIAKGGGAALTDIDTNYMARDITRILNETGTYDKMWNTMKPGNWLNAAQIISEKLNAIGRIGYTELQKSQGVPPIKATTQSRVAWIDYSEKATAAFAQWMARVTPFMRADILGMDMSAKGVKADPLGVLKRSIYAVTIPNMVLYALNYLQDKYDDSIPEDQKYRNLQWYDKDLFYVLPQLGGVRIKIPNPFLVGLPFGAVTRRLLDHFMDTDLDAFDHWAKSFVTQFVPSMIPTVAMAPGQWWANKNWFTGYQLIPDSLKGASGPMQYTPYTTEASKKLSVGLKHIGLDVSPINLDQVTHDLFGTLGYSLLKAGNYALRPDDPKPSELADIPFVGSFLMRSSPGMSAEPIQNFYDRRDKLAEALKDKAAAVQRVRRRDPQGAAQLEDALGQITEQVMQAEATAKGLRVLNSAIQGIYNDPVKTREEIARMSNAERSETHAKTIDDKRQLIDEYTGLMITLARVQLGVWKTKRSPEDLANVFDAANAKLQQEP